MGLWDVWDIKYSKRWIFGMWDFWNVRYIWDEGHRGSEMLGMWDVRDAGCLECGILSLRYVWDVGCGMFAGMWDNGL